MQWGEEHSMLSNFLQRDLEEFVERIRETLLLVSRQSIRVPHVVQFLETRDIYLSSIKEDRKKSKIHEEVET